MAAQMVIPCGSRDCPIRVRDGVRIQIADSPRAGNAVNVPEAVRAALDNPVGSFRIEEIVRAGNTVCIVCDDITRMTPVPEILAELLPRLHDAGVVKKDVIIAIALGSHRKMTDAELERKVGKRIFAEYTVLQSEFRDATNLVQAGTSQLGTPIMVLREILAADVRIGVGTIAPHGCMGWSGGAKILYPGVTSEGIVSEFHAMQGLADGILLGMDECPVRLDVERWAERIGLDFIINTVLLGDSSVRNVVAGHFVAAHRVGVRYAREICGTAIDVTPDVVLVSANPLEGDLWQCGKALYGAASVARRGGSLILLASCCEGVGPHERFMEYTGMRDGAAVLEKRLRAGETGEDLLVMAVGACMGKINADFHVTVVSDGLIGEQLALGGYEWFPEDSLQAALDRALARYENPALLVIPAGGKTVPFAAGSVSCGNE